MVIRVAKCIVFRAAGPYARFRKAYTTVSALSFLVMHPVAVKGLAGALCGIGREDLYEWSLLFKVGVQCLSPVNKDMQQVNLLSMKNDGKPMFSSYNHIEFLRDVRYRIFIKAPNEPIAQMDRCLRSGERPFIPYLGASECPARIEYEGVAELTPLEGGPQLIHSWVPDDYFSVDFEKNRFVYGDNLPVRANSLREYVLYRKIWFAPGGIFGTMHGGEAERNAFRCGKFSVFFL